MLMFKEKNKNGKQRRWLGVLAILLILYGVSLFVPLISPFSRYPLFVIYCRKLPIEASNFAASNSYSLPGDRTYRIDPFIDNYFCTEKQAQAAGFHRSPLVRHR
jgi:hypothetical protein